MTNPTVKQLINARNVLSPTGLVTLKNYLALNAKYGRKKNYYNKILKEVSNDK